jgi:hypothetical protein
MYERPEDLWTFKEYGPDASDPVCYDLAEAIRAWLEQNKRYQGLSMCEVALIHPDFRAVRELVQAVDVFWSHVQQETVGNMCTHMIENGGGGENSYNAVYAAARQGVWPKNHIWVDMFSLRQGTCDFDVHATVELIRDIGVVEAMANDGYFKRSFCLLETYALASSTGKQVLNINNAGEGVNVDSANAGTRNPDDANQVRSFIEGAFGGGDISAFAVFDDILEDLVARTVKKKKSLVVGGSLLKKHGGGRQS